MKSPSETYLNKRVLKLNVGFLLSQGPGASHDSRLDIPSPVRVDDDLTLDYVNGRLRLSRTKEGILVQSNLHVGTDNQCSRCLETISQDIQLDLEELYSHLSPVDTEFHVGADSNLDLAPLLRAEVLLAKSRPVLCQDDCKGLCPQCGANLNRERCQCDTDFIDPRLAKLKQLLDSGE